MDSNDARRRLTGVPRLSQMNALSRREFLRRAGYGALFVAGGPILLAACGDETGDTGGDDGAKKLTVANWQQYIDELYEGSPFTTTTLEDFEATTGIALTYLGEDVNDNNEWFGKFQAQLANGDYIDRDVVMLTDWMAGRMIEFGYVQEIDKANVPNAVNLIDSLKSPSFDPTRAYTLPWQSGFAGIGYNAETTQELLGREITSVNDIFDPALAGRVTMLTEMRDTLGLVMLGLGLDPSTATVEDGRKAADKIQVAVDSGQIRQFTGNEYADMLVSGDVVAAFAWSGDVIQKQFEDDRIQWAALDEGYMLWADNMMILQGTPNKAEAEAFMNYYYDPEVAAKVESWVNYIGPVKGAQAAMEDIDEDLAADPLIFPDEAALAQSHIFKGLDNAEDAEFNQMFAEVIGV
jgi:spermidine/putrescine transport system substrate-binding protein